jgi:hypothetical protein
MAIHAKPPAPTTDTAPGDHDAWIRSEVEKTLKGLKDGSVGVTAEDEHDRRWREKRAAMLATSRKL